MLDGMNPNRPQTFRRALSRIGVDYIILDIKPASFSSDPIMMSKMTPLQLFWHTDEPKRQ